MSNLIPPQGHTSVTREYIVRILSVYGFLLASVLVALSALVVPTYALVNTQLGINVLQDPAGNTMSNVFRDAENTIEQANELLTQLAVPSRSIHASELLKEIQKSAREDITFKNFQIEQTQEKDSRRITVQVQGIAGSRSALARLKENLETSPLFEHAEVPISDLARDAELPFVITLTVTSESLLDL